MQAPNNRSRNVRVENNVQLSEGEQSSPSTKLLHNIIDKPVGDLCSEGMIIPAAIQRHFCHMLRLFS